MECLGVAWHAGSAAKGNFAPSGELEAAGGRLPVAGAILVFRPGVNGVSWLGHVAYVEAVGPAQGIPAGSFKLSEMNFAGWNRVDYRVLGDNDPSILGFIYGN